jgi:ATPase subunit of ABC transporter with duplicated ATPase domains
MSLISARAVGVTLRDTLFSDLDLVLQKGDRLGLVAANGRGKSTLLRILAGREEATTGEVVRARGTQVGLVTQDVPEALLPLTFRAAVMGDRDPDEGWRADIAMDDFAVPEELRERPLAALSGGWRRLAALARVWVGEPDVLLLDEPTNHLDLARIGWLERWLCALPRDVAVIVASHDRAFLDVVCTRTLFLRPRESGVFALRYSRAKAALEEADAARARAFDNDMARAEQLRRQAAKLKNIGINSGSDLLVVKTKQLTERAARIEAEARAGHKETSAGVVRLEGQGSHARALVTLDDAEIATPDGRVLFRTGKLWISPGERVVVLGANGAGKSRLLSAVGAAVRGAATETLGGAIRVAVSLRAGEVDQELAGIAGEASALAAVTRRTDLGEARARAVLAEAGFDIAAQSERLARLSGGQRARLAMVLLRLARPNFYLLDEPTNHLDIAGQEALEAELAEQAAAALIVSHDRRFVEGAGNRFWLIEGKRLREVEGPEGYFRAAMG